MSLTAQAATIAHLTAENAQLRAEVDRLTREIRIMKCMQEVIDAQVISRLIKASTSGLRVSPRMEAA